MKKGLALLAVLALLLGLATVVGASSSNDPSTWDASIFEIPADFYEMHEDWNDDYEGIECMEPIDLGVYHYHKGGVSYYQWLDKVEKIPTITEENGGCFAPPTISSATVVFWNGVPNLPKDMFKWWEGKTKDVYIPDSVTEIDEDCFVQNSTITLHFTANNAVALAYAQAHGMAYAIVPEAEEVSDPDTSEPVSEPDTSEPVSEPSDISEPDASESSDVSHDVMLSDADGDGEVTMKDVLLIRKFIANMDVTLNKTVTDVNGDDSTDMKDVLTLRRQIAHAEK